MEEEIFSKSIELEPAWVGKTVLDGYVMKALEIEKVWRPKQHNYNGRGIQSSESREISSRKIPMRFWSKYVSSFEYPGFSSVIGEVIWLDIPFLCKEGSRSCGWKFGQQRTQPTPSTSYSQ